MCSAVEIAFTQFSLWSNSQGQSRDRQSERVGEAEIDKDRETARLAFSVGEANTPT